MSEEQITRLVDAIMRHPEPTEVRRIVRLALAAEAEECAAMMIGGELCEIHSNVVGRATRHRNAAEASLEE